MAEDHLACFGTYIFTTPSHGEGLHVFHIKGRRRSRSIHVTKTPQQQCYNVDIYITDSPPQAGRNFGQHDTQSETVACQARDNSELITSDNNNIAPFRIIRKVSHPAPPPHTYCVQSLAHRLYIPHIIYAQRRPQAYGGAWGLGSGTRLCTTLVLKRFEARLQTTTNSVIVVPHSTLFNTLFAIVRSSKSQVQ